MLFPIPAKLRLEKPMSRQEIPGTTASSRNAYGVPPQTRFRKIDLDKDFTSATALTQIMLRKTSLPVILSSVGLN